MNPGEPLPVSQHDLEIQANRLAWQRKPILRSVYRGFHELIASRLDRTVPGQVVELGSGMGSIKDVIADCVTTDLFPNPWLDCQENAYRLSFADAAVSNLILFDPAMSWTGRVIYGLFHHEPIGMRLPITWEAPAGFKPEDSDYFAAQGAATRIFWQREAPERLADWTLVEVTPIPAFEYFATGGFSGPQIGGPGIFRVWRRLDRALSRWPNLFAARLLVVLKRTQ